MNIAYNKGSSQVNNDYLLSCQYLIFNIENQLGLK